MKFSVSDLLFPGFQKFGIRPLNKKYGIEFFYEFGKDYYWDEEVAAWGDRDFSIHAPCVAVDLAAAADHTYLQALEQTLAYAKKINVEFVVVHTNEVGTNDKATTQALVKARLAEVLALGEKYGVTIVIENVGLRVKNNVVFNLEEYLELFQTFPKAKALIDTGHAHVNGWDIPAVIKALGDRLIAYHIHDNDGGSDAHLPVGHGNIPWDRVFAAMKEYTPEATVVCEYRCGFENTFDLEAHIEKLIATYNL